MGRKGQAGGYPDAPSRTQSLSTLGVSWRMHSSWKIGRVWSRLSASCRTTAAEIVDNDLLTACSLSGPSTDKSLLDRLLRRLYMQVGRRTSVDEKKSALENALLVTYEAGFCTQSVLSDFSALDLDCNFN